MGQNVPNVPKCQKITPKINVKQKYNWLATNYAITLASQDRLSGTSTFDKP